MSPTPASDLAVGRRRLKLVGAGLALAFAAIGGRLVELVPWRSNGELTRAVLTPAANAALPPAFVDAQGASRFDITDRNGVLLATNLLMPSVIARPELIADKPAAAKALAALLRGVDGAKLLDQLERPGRVEVLVKPHVSPVEEAAVLEAGVPGVTFDRKAEHRVYPKAELTSHLIGFVDVDDVGQAGVERAFDDRLRARSGRGPLALSIDLRLQQVVHEELGNALDRFAGKGAVGLVLDRLTGEVLAMVSLPDFDPNRPDIATDDQKLNRATGGSYELGSLFKVFTTAMALDGGAVRLGDRFDATKPLQIGRNRIHDDHPRDRWLAVPECFMYSSNICTSRIAFAAGGAPAMQAFFRKLGFYDRLAVDLPRTELARPQTPRRWGDLVTATTSFGHNIAVSPLQFAAAMSGIVGDGTRAPLSLLARPGRETPARERLVRPETAELMRYLMWLVVERGTAPLAKTPAYLLGGKTGTADKAVIGGRGYRHDAVLASFAAVFPLEQPRYLVFAMLDEPHGDAAIHGLHQGGWTAAPVVGAIVDRIGPILDVGPSDGRLAAAYDARWLAAMGPGNPAEARLAATDSDR